MNPVESHLAPMLLQRYAAGTTVPEETSLVEEHLEHCERCGKLMDQVQLSQDSLVVRLRTTYQSAKSLTASREAREYMVEIRGERDAAFRFVLRNSVILGRQKVDEPPPYFYTNGPIDDRVVIAPIAQRTVSRNHVRLQPCEDDSIEVENLSVRGRVLVNGFTVLPQGHRVRASKQLELDLGEVTIAVRRVSSKKSTVNDRR